MLKNDGSRSRRKKAAKMSVSLKIKCEKNSSDLVVGAGS